MDKSRWFLIIYLIYLLGFVSHALYLKKTVYGDGIFYYSWLRSVVVDHDLDFRNEYAHFGVSSPLTAEGLPGNKYAVGPAILWFPVYSATHSLVRGNGYGLPYQLAVGASSVAYVFIGFLLLYNLLQKFFRPNISLLTILAIALATNLFYYGSLDTVNSHAVSFFAVCVFLSFLLREKKNWFLIGLSLGLIALIRSQDVVIGLAALPFIKLRNLRALVLGTVSGFVPQLLDWQALYGKFWISPYLASGDYFDFSHPHLYQVLFAPWTGFILTSPILILGILGIFFWKNKLRHYLLLVILIEIIIITTYSQGQGATFGSRMMISTLPLFAFGLGWAFNWLKRHSLNLTQAILILVTPLSALNLLLTFLYLLLH